jgi:FkbM family methyltransferase
MREVDDKHLYFSGPALQELTPFQKYGPDKSSQFYEEWFIRNYFQDRRDGIFLDVGANHYKRDSTTYFLETSLGWSGFAIEPQKQFAADYARYRPRTRFVPMFASDVPDARVKFFVPSDSRVASSNQTFTAQYGNGVAGQETEVPTTTLTAVLDQAGVQRLDFLSMDIELAEPKALAGFDIDRFKPALVCIEAHHEVRQQIIDYFALHDYVVIGRYLRADPHNLYFRPIRAAQESKSP